MRSEVTQWAGWDSIILLKDISAGWQLDNMSGWSSGFKHTYSTLYPGSYSEPATQKKIFKVALTKQDWHNFMLTEVQWSGEVFTPVEVIQLDKRSLTDTVKYNAKHIRIKPGCLEILPLKDC